METKFFKIFIRQNQTEHKCEHEQPNHIFFGWIPFSNKRIMADHSFLIIMVWRSSLPEKQEEEEVEEEKTIFSVKRTLWKGHISFF